MMRMVLVVDDDPAYVRSAALLLKHHGFLVEGVSSGEDAARFVRGCSTALVLLDYDMPGMDGLTTLQTIRQASPTTLVAMVSGVIDLGAALRGYELGVVEVLRKDEAWDMATLAPKVRIWLELQAAKAVASRAHGFNEEVFLGNLRQARAALERSRIEKEVEACKGNKKQAAGRLGVSYSTLKRRLAEPIIRVSQRESTRKAKTCFEK